MAVLRTYEDVLAFDGGPTEAEQQLIDACKAGEQCTLGPDRPDTPDSARTIRADILRYLIVGGCEKCQVGERGVHLVGGYIIGSLDTSFAAAHGATMLEKCFFASRFDSVQTQFQLFNLSGSHLNGLFAQGAKIEGSVFLRDTSNSDTIRLNSSTIGGQLACEGAELTATKDVALTFHSAEIGGTTTLQNVQATGTVDLRGATIGGTLVCVGAFVKSQSAYSVIASDAQIDGGVILHPRSQEDKGVVQTPFRSTGEIQLNGATIGGLYAQQTTLVATSTGQSLSLGGATVNGSVRLDGCSTTGEILLAGSRISGRLTCERLKLRNDNGHAFNGQAMRVEHSFVWKKVEHHSGAVSLNGAHVTELDDHPDNWPNSDRLFLDGFTYDRIKGTVSTSPARMDWLKSGSYFGDEFRPQPYSQYAKFLRDTGHDEDARHVLYTRERKRRASTRAQLNASGHSFAGPLNLWAGFWDILLRLVVGYGHHPFRSVAALAMLICCTVIPAHYAWEEGSFAPNAAPVLVSEHWTTLASTES
ncbi:hypothetical protein [uncultured Tateyamaria sp.]|uniref:hypothetical protein n=1 Tax=uncultured Tateyamaria sp. TaxID=455651 RepID=UPI00262BAE18|nr:hypothetical protein [uncultured Tateyamaria sp.]